MWDRSKAYFKGDIVGKCRVAGVRWQVLAGSVIDHVIPTGDW